jgi:hypothetical protein
LTDDRICLTDQLEGQHQAASRQVFLVVALVAQHFEPGEQCRLDIAAEQLMHRQRVLEIEVSGIGSHALAQCAHIGIRCDDVAEREQRGESFHCGVRRIRALQTLQLLARAIEIAVESLQLREPRLQVEVVAIARQLVLQDRARAGEIARRFELLRLLHRTVDRLRQMLLQHLLDLRLGHHADEVIDDGAVLEKHHGGQAADADLLRQLLLLVGVHLGELEAPSVLRGQAVEDRHQLLAGSAPGRPEVHEHGRLAGRLDDVGHEGGAGHGQGGSGFGHERASGKDGGGLNDGDLAVKIKRPGLRRRIGVLTCVGFRARRPQQFPQL